MTPHNQPAPEHAQVRECIGAHVLRQREFMRVAEDFDADIAAYRRANPRGLTRDGVLALLSREVFGGTPLDGRILPKPDLNDPEVGYPPLGEWAARAGCDDPTRARASRPHGRRSCSGSPPTR